MRRTSLVGMMTLGPLLLLVPGCVDDQGNPSTVEDLRVLALALESPELMSPNCDPTAPESLTTAATPVEFRALIAYPGGEGHMLSYELRACAESARATEDADGPSDATCDDPATSVLLGAGSTNAGELSFEVTPGVAFLPDGTPLLQRTLERDDFRGLGGIRVPLQLRVRDDDAGSEVRAEKLMVYSCQLFPEMTQNVTPQLGALALDDEPWDPTQVRELRGPGPFGLRPEDFSVREEDYVVPSFTLEPVALKESWKLSWFTTLGELSPTQTGGTAFDGVESPHYAEWELPEEGAPEQEVTFWVVVRDGRGGTSWTSRRVRWAP